jgi:hypothetical protein
MRTSCLPLVFLAGLTASLAVAADPVRTRATEDCSAYAGNYNLVNIEELPAWSVFEQRLSGKSQLDKRSALANMR